MAFRVLRIAAATAIFASVLVAQSAGAVHAATAAGDIAQVPIPADELPPTDPSGLIEPLPTVDPPSGVELPTVIVTVPPTPADDILADLPLPDLPVPDPVPEDVPPPIDPAPEPPSEDGSYTDPLDSVAPPPADVSTTPEIDVPPTDIAGDGSCCGAPPVDPPAEPPAADPGPPAPASSPPAQVGSPPAQVGSAPAEAGEASETVGPDDRAARPGPTSSADWQTGRAPAGATSRDADDPTPAVTAAQREAADPADTTATPHRPRRADPGHAPRPGDANPSIDGAAVASAGIAAGLAVVNRAPAGVTIAIEFGRVGGGWAGAIVFNLWLRRQLSARRMSARQLAALSGVDHTTISRLLREDRHPSLSTATKIVHALRGVPNDAAEPATADYFDRLPEETIFPARRVELALRADEQLDDDQVRRLMTLYLNARRRSAATRGHPPPGEPEEAARASRR